MSYRKNGKVSESGDWMRRMEASKKVRDRHAKNWDENRRLLLGTEGIKGFKRGELVNLAWAAFQTMIGSVYAQNPMPIIREKKGDLQVTARMLTDIVVSDLDEMRSRSVTRQCISDVFWAGFGVVVEKLQSDVTSQNFRYTAQGQTLEVNAEVPTNQRYSLNRVYPKEVLFDPLGSTADLRDSKWVGLPCYMTIKELRDSEEFSTNDEILKKLRRMSGPPGVDGKLQGSTKWSNPRNTDAYDSEESDEMAQVKIYEFWDRVNKKRVYIPDGMDKVILQDDWPIELRLNGELLFPCNLLYFNENPDELYPIPEISMIAPQLKQFSVLFRRILRDAIEKWRKVAVRGDVLSPSQQSKLEEGDQNSVIVVDPTKAVVGGQNLPMDQIVMPIKDPVVDRDVMAVAEMVKGLIHEVVGAGDFASAGFRSTRSATEAAALSDFLRSRMTSRTENIDAFFKAVITTHVLYLQETLSEDRAVSTTDENGMSVWKTYNKANIAGTFQFSVIAGSSTPRNTETTRQENISFFQQIFPAIQQAGGNIRPMIDWIAPFYKVPQHLVDQSFNNHRQALQQLALMFAAIHSGAKIPGAQVIEAISMAINTGLSQADIQQITQQAAQAQAQAPPGGMPGTNTSNQTLPS